VKCGIAALLAVVSVGCATWRGEQPPPPYVPDRNEYAAFRAAHPKLIEPNYLPFVTHRTAIEGERDAMMLCRWPDEDMPIPVFVSEPVIAAEVQDEFLPRPPDAYVRSVARALDTWEEHLEGLVRFRRVSTLAEAKLHIELLGERAPVAGDEVTVLGTTRMADACQPLGWDPDADRQRVAFAISDLRIYLADDFGLLSEDQVEWIALHELGHALGMRGHSPIPADLMFEVVRDRMTVSEGLSVQDVNTFVSLYRLPNGTVFARVPEDGQLPRAERPPPSGPPLLALAPHVDARLGFNIRPPRGWLALETRQGMIAVDGTTWDYTASFQVVVSRFAGIDAYVQRYREYYRRRGRLVHTEEMVINGREARQGLLLRAGGELAEEVTLIDGGDGRVWVITAECPTRDLPAFHAWFDASLASLEIWQGTGH
jgi:hypothetical protein